MFAHKLPAAAAALMLGFAAVAPAHAQDYASMDAKDSPDIVETAIAAGTFTTLVAAVQAAGLVEVLQGDGPFTVFAPSDEAFAKLPAGTVESLLEPENKETLIAILTYHVIPGKYMAADVVAMDEATTVEGSDVSFSVSDDGARINAANIVATDIVTSNGVIHVIDAVILPPKD